MSCSYTCVVIVVLLQKGDEVYVVDCAQSDRWYGISSNNNPHGYFLPAHVAKADKIIMVCIDYFNRCCYVLL